MTMTTRINRLAEAAARQAMDGADRVPEDALVRVATDAVVSELSAEAVRDYVHEQVCAGVASEWLPDIALGEDPGPHTRAVHISRVTAAQRAAFEDWRRRLKAGRATP